MNPDDGSLCKGNDCFGHFAFSVSFLFCQKLSRNTNMPKGAFLLESALTIGRANRQSWRSGNVSFAFADLLKKAIVMPNGGPKVGPDQRKPNRPKTHFNWNLLIFTVTVLFLSNHLVIWLHLASKCLTKKTCFLPLQRS